jgi:hypothetical protein
MAGPLQERELPAYTSELEPLGRARRFACEEGELWVFAAPDGVVVERLLSLGECGVGGFVGGGRAPDGAVWALRAQARRTAGELARGERLPWRRALEVVRDVARSLSHCERLAIFPGPLQPREIVLEPSVVVLATSFVRALVGEPRAAGASSTAPSPKWTPPEQTEGASWDSAANRYVLGLVAYRLVAGQHPFGGAGLRHALSEQFRAPAPFEDAIARELEPGVQSFVLQMLDPDARARPRDASAIARRCEELLGERREPRERSASRDRVPSKEDRREGRSKKLAFAASRAPKPRRALVVAAPIAAGAMIAAAVIALAAPSSAPSKKPAPAVRPSEPLATANASECATCHPRQVAEWQRSVMAHSVKSPLFGALESVVEEQVGREDACPNGAGILRKTGGDACRADRTGIAVTGSGGEHWCVNCHAAGENLRASMPAWSALGGQKSRAPLRDLLPASTMDGISCAVCHTTEGPVRPRGSGRAYEGNPTWTSTVTGAVFSMRPEDARGLFGISNSGYRLEPSIFLGAGRGTRPGDPFVHRRAPEATARHLRTSEFCGACHDVRLFGTDTIGVRERGEHFKRLRNGYTEWRTWADAEARAGRAAPTCQDCHMSLYPGVCVPDGAGPASAGKPDKACPSGTHFEPRPAGSYARASVVTTTTAPARVATHYFTSVDVPLAPSYPDVFADDRRVDGTGLPVGLRARRDLLLRHTFDFSIGQTRRFGDKIEIPIQIQNTGAGHRVPAGFSQEREIWVELRVTDARGGVVYEVGRLASDDADLKDKIFLRINTSDAVRDGRGRPLGVFGADVVDGPDVPQWSPSPRLGGTTFRGKGLINLQNGFLRCVRCIGFVDAQGRCQPGFGQGRTRADRFDDGAYDPDTGECRSNLSGGNELFETYFPVGALDASRGILKAPDAIIDTRSAPPGVPLLYTYELDAAGHPRPFKVEARLRFRAFPPYLVRAFADYEQRKASEGLRPSGAQVTLSMLRRIEPIDLAEASARIE